MTNTTTPAATANLHAYLIDTESCTYGPTDLNQSLESFCDALHCDLIDVAYLPINGKEFCFIVDDCGLLKSDSQVSVVDECYSPTLVGSVLIVSAEEGGDEDDGFKSISEADCWMISQHIYIQDIPVPDKEDYCDQARVREFLKTGYCMDCMQLLFG